ncbi:leucine-rich repeat-containing protein kinase family protein [Acidisphaera sp. L21]|uniref:leucine-rich repeat-containing protein kinase family protein n=1 Tax=Acidisphaera sp. L21 TaxID=1641851 RepID=UPI0020B13BB2|nr:leucine-rich repeat-containing protein kinase family protein [Acidisphaera sp. L21]
MRVQHLRSEPARLGGMENAVSIDTTLDALRQGTLAGVRTLTLRAGLTEFPPEIFGLADTLEMLDLSGNALTSLPADLGRLRRLRVLFCSGNRFDRLPPSLGDCLALTQIGFRGVGLREVPTEALPPALRWLTLTDNWIEHLPDALGRRPALQKLMLAGNRLRNLPESLGGAASLELLRLSANAFDALPGWLPDLPNLAWLAWAGNPFDRAAARAPTTIAWDALELGAMLGEGASGQVHQAYWPAAGHDVALKLFKGTMTSDGLPEREMAALLAADAHPNLSSALGQVTDHPQQLSGLVMKKLPPHWRPLAGPPSLESCTRDVYDEATPLDPDAALRIIRGVGSATAHLHARGVSHGDLYAHNILWDGTAGDSVLTDFGAASFMPPGQAASLQRIEMRAWGLLLGELLDRCEATGGMARGLRAVQHACLQPNPSARPAMADALSSLQ